MVRTMGVEAEYVKRIEHLVKPFVELGIYDSPAKALRSLIDSLVKSRIRAYERKVKRFESKHRMSLAEFTKSLEGKATPVLEDDWMEWESAINMLEAWKRASKEIGLSAI